MTEKKQSMGPVQLESDPTKDKQFRELVCYYII